MKANDPIAERVRPEDLELEIAREQYHVPEGTCLTICMLTLRNGYIVTGESACAVPENFDAVLGRKIARENAKEKLWPLLGFRLRDRLTNGGRK